MLTWKPEVTARLTILLVLRFLFGILGLDIVRICGKRSHDCPAPVSSKKYSLLQQEPSIHCGLSMHATFDKGHLPPCFVQALHCGTHPSPYTSNIFKTWVLRNWKCFTKLTQSEFSFRHVQLLQPTGEGLHLFATNHDYESITVCNAVLFAAVSELNVQCQSTHSTASRSTFLASLGSSSRIVNSGSAI